MHTLEELRRLSREELYRFFEMLPQELGVNSYEALDSLDKQTISAALEKLQAHRLDQGYKIDFVGTLLHFAAIAGHLGAIKALIQHFCFTKDAVNEAGQNILHFTALNGHLPILEVLLDDSLGLPFDVASVTHDGMNILHFAALNGHLSIVLQAIQKYGLLADSKTNEGLGILHFAALWGQVDFIHDLSLHGYCTNKISEDNQGRTPLQLAAWNGDIKVMRAMIERLGFNPNYTNSQNHNLLFWAEKGEHADAIAFCQNVALMNKLYESYYACFTKGVKTALATEVTHISGIKTLVMSYLESDSLYKEMDRLIHNRNKVLKPLIFYSTDISQPKKVRNIAKNALNQILTKSIILPHELKGALNQLIASKLNTKIKPLLEASQNRLEAWLQQLSPQEQKKPKRTSKNPISLVQTSSSFYKARKSENNSVKTHFTRDKVSVSDYLLKTR
jgi:hypothetical protein